MSQAFVSCPQTGKDVYTGLNLEWFDLEALEIGEQVLICPVCGETHRWTKDDINLRADGSGG